MTNVRRSQSNPNGPEMPFRVDQRLTALFQRLSSAISFLIPNLHLWEAVMKPREDQRPKTASSPHRIPPIEISPGTCWLSDSQQAPNPEVGIPTFTVLNEYLHDPSVEHSSCGFCGLQPLLTPPPGVHRLSGPSALPKPSLRGGAGATSDLKDTDRLSQTLYWLAGGTGKKQITVASWKTQRAKQRMGGLVGMAVYGKRVGTAYANETQVDNATSEAAAAVAKGRTGNLERIGIYSDSPKDSLKSVKSPSSKASSVSEAGTSSPCSSVRTATAAWATVAPGGDEATKEVTHGSVPEEVAAVVLQNQSGEDAPQDPVAEDLGDAGVDDVAQEQAMDAEGS